MKSILTNESCEKKEKPFPKLMIGDTGIIWLMECESFGTVIHRGESHLHAELGFRSDGIAMSRLKDYEGSVCLSND